MLFIVGDILTFYHTFMWEIIVSIDVPGDIQAVPRWMGVLVHCWVAEESTPKNCLTKSVPKFWARSLRIWITGSEKEELCTN